MKKIFNILFGGRFWLLKTLFVLAIINIAATQVHSRLDLTAEKRFTLSYGTKKILRNLKEPVNVQVFLQGNLPSAFKKMAASTSDILNAFKEEAGNNVNFEFVDPSTTMDGTDIKFSDSLPQLGFVPLNLTSQREDGQEQQLVFPYAYVRTEENAVPVTLYKGKTPMVSFQETSNAESLLEYQFASAIVNATQAQKHIVAYATGNGEPEQLSTYDLVENVLSPNYQLYTFNLETQPFVPAEFEVLMIVKPTKTFTDQQKLKIDQFVMRGGKLMVFMDKLNAELDSLGIGSGRVVAYDRDLQLNDLLFKYGARVNSDLVMDLQCDVLPFDVNGNGQFELLPWNYFLVMEPGGQSSITKNLGYVSGKFVNSIDTVGEDNIKKTVLLHSSPNARTIATPAIISGAENEIAQQSEKYKKANIPTAVLLEGKFESLYARRMMQWMKDSLAKYEVPYNQAAVEDGKIIVVADGDVILNGVVKGNQPISMGMNAYTYGTQREFPFANRDFLLNSLSYLLDNSGLSESRSKEIVPRLLDTKLVQAEEDNWKLINIISPILLILGFAFVYNFLRKRKYQ